MWALLVLQQLKVAGSSQQATAEPAGRGWQSRATTVVTPRCGPYIWWWRRHYCGGERWSWRWWWC